MSLICKADSKCVFLHTECRNKGRVVSVCFFAYFIFIFTEVNIFPWYFESKLLILHDLFFSQELEEPMHMQIH